MANRDHGDPSDAPVRPTSPGRRSQRRSPVSRRGSAHNRRLDHHRHLGDPDGHRGSLGVVRDLRAARRRARALCLQLGGARPQPRRRPAGQHRYRRDQLQCPDRSRVGASRWQALSSDRPATKQRRPCSTLSGNPAAKYYINSFLFVGCCGYTGCAGSADTAGWTRRPVRPTRRPRPTRSNLGPPAR